MISIVGAGPAGSHAAYLLAKQGHDVSLFEEHSVIGNPCQCTGILTHSFEEIIKPHKDFLVNKIKRFRVYSPDDNFIEFKLDNEETIIDRPQFDRHLARKAEDAGVKIYTAHRFETAVGNGIKKITVKDLKEKKIREFKADYLIGADGPSSQVAKTFNLLGKRTNYIGAQATVKYNLDPDLIETYFGQNFPEFFGWITPENNSTVRIGLASKKNSFSYFNNFLKMKGIKESDIIEKQGGIIPMYTNKVQTKKDNVFLVGDAALQIKSTTGGGIFLGLIGAETLADSIINKKDYEKEWKKKIRKDLTIHLMIRNIMNKFTDEDYNYLTSLFNKDKVKRVIEECNREYPSQFMLKLLLSEPRFLYYLRKLF